MLVAALLLGACSTGNLFGGRSALLGDRKASDPLAAAEAYQRQYQPGDLPRVFQTTRIYDRHGVLIGETFGEGRRVWVPLDAISQSLIDATIAVEDATFYTNPGIDPKRIAGAAIQNLQEGEVVSGASTITMQLARNLFLGPDQRYDQSVDRKVLEAGLAQELTELYTKDEILEMYLNLLNYGQLAYGPEAAAQVYFGKPAKELTPAEATMLAGLPQQPANLNPYQNWDAARARQRIVLDMMVRHGALTQAEVDAIFAEAPVLAGEPGLAPNLAPHFVQAVIEELNAQLGEGYIQRAGFQVITTLDLGMQQLAQETVAAKVAELQPVFDLSNAALVALQPGTGEVLAMVGSADFTSEAISGQVNVSLARRQPGSSIKPVLIAAALEDNLVSPASVVWDIPVTYTVGLPQAVAGAVPSDQDLVYRPRNYDETFHGPVTVRSALANSYNVPMIKMLARLGVPRMLEVARRMGITSLDQTDDWYGLSLTLGGGEVTLLDLTTAYHTLANGGVYRSPKLVHELRSSLGEVVAVEDLEGDRAANNTETTGPADGDQVLSPETAFIVTDILSDRTARLAAFGENNPLTLSRPAAAKTGTTTDYRDNWTLGYTRYLVAGVWAGNSDGRPMQNASGVTGAAPIWQAFMEGVLARPDLMAALEMPQDPAAWEFVPPPATLSRIDQCPPGVACRNDGEYLRASWLETWREQGALSDSVVQVPSAPVYTRRGDQAVLSGYCGLESAATRTMLRLPGTGSLELSPDLDATQLISVTSAESAAALSSEQLQAMAWAVRKGAPVYLGPCDRLQTDLTAALALEPQDGDGDLQVRVDLAAAGDPNAVALSPDGGVPLDVVSRAVTVNELPSGGVYTLAEPVTHDTNCPGNYVVGIVLDQGGAPLPNVRLVLTDPWGNQAVAISKSGSDSGRFDFPLYVDGPHDLFLTVTDDAGNPLSPTVVVPHRQDPASDAPCHHVVLRQAGQAVEQVEQVAPAEQSAVEDRDRGRGNDRDNRDNDRDDDDRNNGRGNGRGRDGDKDREQ
jgi:penicillin-binding protein 1C